MPQLTLPAADIGLPLTRRDIEQHVDALIDLLDTLDPDPDLEPDITGYSDGMDSREGDDADLEDGNDDEPSLGWQGPSGYLGESTNQGAADFCGHTNDCEDEHDGAEPDIEEGSLGWTEMIHQDGVNWHGGYHGDLECEHDGKEPDLGWTDAIKQAGLAWEGHPYCQRGEEGSSPEWQL